MKRLVLGSLALLVLAFAIPALASQPAVPADGLKMEKGKQPVVFNHSTHKEITCGQCHHPVEGKENFQKCGTAGCHDSMDRKDKSVKGYYNAMHGKDLKYPTCLTCHREMAEKQPEKKKELTACKQSKCHP